LFAIYCWPETGRYDRSLNEKGKDGFGQGATAGFMAQVIEHTPAVGVVVALLELCSGVRRKVKAFELARFFALMSDLMVLPQLGVESSGG
jgi:hypothetical protein